MKNIIASIIIIFTCTACFGQQKDDHLAYFNWGIGPAINNSFVHNFSGKGANAGYEWFLKDNLSVGAAIGWYNYDEYKIRQTYATKDGANTTDMYTYLYTVPVTATITKFFKAGQIVYPYAKLGVGTMYSEQNMYYNIYETDNSNWGFVLSPEIGTHIKLNPANPWAFNMGIQYRYATNSAKQFNISNTEAYSINLGIAIQMK